MEKETELYLMEQIRKLESENAFLQGKVKDYEDKEEIIRKSYDDALDLEKALDNHFFGENIDITKIVKKAIAFDKIQQILNLAVSNYVDSNRYLLYTTKPYIKKQIEIEIDESTFKELWGAFNGN